MTHVMEGETTRGRNDSGRNDSGRTGKWAKRPVTEKNICKTKMNNLHVYKKKKKKMLFLMRYHHQPI